MARAWTEFVEGSPRGAHAAQVYGDLGELAESVGLYLTAGFDAGEPAVVVATREHWSRFAGELSRLGRNPDGLRERGLLAVEDAEELLGSFMDGNRPSAARFESVIGGLLDRAAEARPGRRVRAFGEMVDVLTQRGRLEAALAVEELWNRLARSRDFSLLCGYRLDVFDRASQVSTLPGVCRAHTHVRAAADPARLARAVDRALADVLGADQAGKVYLLVGDEAREERVPVPQLALMWVSRHMPVFAERVLAAARGYYGEPVTQHAA